MIVRSRRLRYSDDPDAPTPGVAASADAAAAPIASKSPSKGLLIGIIAGGTALLLIAVVAVVALVLPAPLGGSSTDGTDVADITREPETTWEYDWVGDNDGDFLYEEPTIVAIGADRALVWTKYSPYAGGQSGSAEWYEGYDEHYEDGYAAGLLYLDACQAYRQAYLDGTLPYNAVYPWDESYRESFFPEGALDALGQHNAEFLGFHDGFYDAEYEAGKGYRKKEQPVDPGYAPTVALLNALSGEVEWTIDLSNVIDGVDYTSTIRAYELEGASAAAIVVSEGDSMASSVVTLNLSNGEVLSQFDSDGPVEVTSFEGDIIIASWNEDGDETTVGRYSVDNLDDDPKWETQLFGGAYLASSSTFILVFGDDKRVVLNGSNGEEADWGDDVGATYFFVGSQLLRVESTEDGPQLEGWNANDDSTWEHPIDAEYYSVLDGSLFVAETTGDGYSKLQRINPSNGQEIWADTFDDDFDSVLGLRGSNLLLESGIKVIVVDLGSGEEKFSQKVGKIFRIYEGSSLYYVHSSAGELVAYSYGEKGDVWKLRLDESESISTLGKHLVLIDYDEGEIRGLADK